MTLITDKTALRRLLESIAADLRHAYGFLQHGQLIESGQKNVSGLIARQIRRIEDVIGCEDASGRQLFLYFCCPLECGYRTGTTGDDDVAARTALVAHLQRLKHGLSRSEAMDLARTVGAVARPDGRVSK